MSTSPTTPPGASGASPSPGQTPKGPSGLLPEVLTLPIDETARTRFYIYGEPGVGKTTLATKFRRKRPDGGFAEPLFAATEEGVGFHSVYKTTIKDWPSFKELLKELLAKDPEATRFSTVIVDTVDLLYGMCERFVCETKGIAHPSDLEWGKGWAALREEFQVVLAYLSRMKQGMVLIGHARVWEKKERGGQAVTCIQPTLGGTARRVVLPLVDVILYVYSQEVTDPVSGKTVTKRYMRTEPTEQVEAKDRTQRLPPIMNLEYTELDDYISGRKVKAAT